MKKIITLVFLTFMISLGASAQFPTWIGIYTPHVNISPAPPYNTGTSITFQVFMNNDYFGLNCDLGIKYSGIDTYYTMSYNGNVDGNSVWFITMSFPLAPGNYEYWFKGWETSSSSEIYDSNGGSNYSFTVNSTLEVDLKLFEAQATNNAVSLTWATLSETNSDYFAVERSLDGKEFEQISIVKAAGNSNVEFNYHYTDREISSINTYYYRLNQYDFDGSNTISKVVTVKLDRKEDLVVYPNPAHDIIFVEDNFGISELGIYDAQFKLVKLVKDVDLGSVDVSSLPKGLYFVRLKGVDSDHIQKLIIQ